MISMIKATCFFLRTSRVTTGHYIPRTMKASLVIVRERQCTYKRKIEELSPNFAAVKKEYPKYYTF